MGGYDRMLGGLLLGAYLNTHFFGLVSYQYASYHTSKFRDPVWIKIIVPCLFCLDAFHTIELIYMIWIYCVTHFAEPEKLFDSEWPYTIAPIVIALSGIIVHTFLGYCAYRSTAKLYLFIIILVPSLASFAVGLSYGVKTISARILPGSASSPSFHTAYHATEFCTNALVSGVLAYVIFTAPSGFRPLEHVAKRVIHGTIQIGLLSTLFSFLCLVTYAALGSSTYYAIFLLPLGRIYSNSLLETLLSREVPIFPDSLPPEALTGDNVQFRRYSSVFSAENDLGLGFTTRTRASLELEGAEALEPGVGGSGLVKDPNGKGKQRLSLR
ncbi:hypothetical protein BDN71DRAFT_1440797 [Pleurotus eryngii]|uniref:DUF6534 domain-containing protein n=1 Tax=Pleurotus eryngii TaxID=5323 RepID=A0A9P6A5X9_PLEER|nr:hypothetical protein BDN71DRAFT_1440797 [Pleurotus eryngii]